MSTRSILVAGATGHQGGAVVDALLTGEYGEFDVYAVTRSPESDQAQALTDRGATVVEGNLLHKGSLRPKLEAVDAVYCVTTFGDGAFDAEIEQGTNMAEVAADAGIGHFVFSSVVGVGRDTGVPHIESKSKIEQRIQELDLPTTIIRPLYFMHNFEGQREEILDGTLASPLTETVSWHMLAVEDLSRLVATALANPEEYVGEVIEVAGDKHTLASAAEVFTTVTGTEVTPQHVPIEIAREELIEELGEVAGEDLATMYEWYNNHGVDFNIEELEHEHAIDFIRLETYLREHDWDDWDN